MKDVKGNDQGDRSWLKDSDDLFAFEISNNQKTTAHLSLIIGPGNQRIRNKWFELCKDDKALFTSAAKKQKGATDKWTRVYTQSIQLSKDLEKTVVAYEKAIDKLFKNDIQEIEQFFLNNQSKIEDES